MTAAAKIGGERAVDGLLVDFVGIDVVDLPREKKQIAAVGVASARRQPPHRGQAIDKIVDPRPHSTIPF